MSAGSQPTGQVHPRSLVLLEREGISTNGLHSKSWENLPRTPDIVVTVCSSAAGETCPAYLGPVLRTHWGVEDPAHARGTDAEIDAAFVSAYSTLRARIEAFMALPLADLQRDRARLKAELDRIGAMSSEPSLLNLTEVPMSTLQVFDPPMCCATGVCGPTVDPNVVQFAADLDWLATRGVTIRRFNLAQEPTSFAENAAVKALLARSNGAELPAIVVDGAVVASGRYPTRDELAAFAGLAAGVATDVRTLAPGEHKVSGSTCCGGPAPAAKAKSCC